MMDNQLINNDGYHKPTNNKHITIKLSFIDSMPKATMMDITNLLI